MKTFHGYEVKVEFWNFWYKQRKDSNEQQYQFLQDINVDYDKLDPNDIDDETGATVAFVNKKKSDIEIKKNETNTSPSMGENGFFITNNIAKILSKWKSFKNLSTILFTIFWKHFEKVEVITVSFKNFAATSEIKNNHNCISWLYYRR